MSNAALAKRGTTCSGAASGATDSPPALSAAAGPRVDCRRDQGVREAGLVKDRDRAAAPALDAGALAPCIGAPCADRGAEAAAFEKGMGGAVKNETEASVIASDADWSWCSEDGARV